MTFPAEPHYKYIFINRRGQHVAGFRQAHCCALYQRKFVINHLAIVLSRSEILLELSNCPLDEAGHYFRADLTIGKLSDRQVF